MRLPWSVRLREWGTGKPQAAAGASSLGVVSSEVERLLTAFRIEPAMQIPEGFEARLLERLQAQSDALRAAAARREALAQAGLRGWAPAALAASLVCVFAGGLMVERDTARAIEQQSHRQQASTVPQGTGPGSNRAGETRSVAIVSQPQAAASEDTSMESTGLGTASARVRPSAPVPAGRRRGRASAGSCFKTASRSR